MKRIALSILAPALLAGCATQTGYRYDPQAASRVYQGAAVGGVVGAGAGALIDKHNRWRGAVIGGALGSVLGGGLTGVQQQ